MELGVYIICILILVNQLRILWRLDQIMEVMFCDDEDERGANNGNDVCR